MKKIYSKFLILTILIINSTNVVASKHKKHTTKAESSTAHLHASSSCSLSNSSLENEIMKNLMREAEVKAKELEEEVSEQTKKLNQKAEQQYRIMQEEITQKTQEIQEIAKKQSEELAHQFKQQVAQVQKEVELTSTALRQQAAQQVVSLFNQAEEEAIRKKRHIEEEALKRKREEEEKELERRRIEREKMITKTLETNKIITPTLFRTDSLSNQNSSLTPIDSVWKEKIAQDFHNNMNLMKKIILDGETESEAQDFMKRFSRQNRWFDTTLGNTTYMCDDNYKEIVKRSTRLENVVRAQKSADLILQKIALEKDLTQDELKKIRLAVLYDLNAKLNHITGEGKRGSLKADELTTIVQQAISDTLPENETTPPQLIALHSANPNRLNKNLSQVPTIITSSFHSDLDMLAQEINSLKKALKHEIKKRKKTKQKIDEKDSKIIDLEARLQQAQQHITQYKEEASSSQEKLSLEIQQTDQTKAREQERNETLTKLQNELDQAKQDVEFMTGKASSELENLQKKVEKLSSSEEKLRKKFAQSLEKEKKQNLALEQTTRTALEENNLLTKKVSRLKQEKKEIARKEKEKLKEKFQGITNKLLSTEIDLQKATGKTSHLERKILEAQSKIINLMQEKEDAIKKTKEELKNKMKKSLEKTQAENINLIVEQRKDKSSIAHLKDKNRSLQKEKDSTIQQIQRDLGEKHQKEISQKESEAQQFKDELIQQKMEAQKELERFQDKAKEETIEAIKNAKHETIASFIPKLETKEKEKLELEVITRKALEETNKIKSDLINAYKEKDRAVKKASYDLKQSIKPKLENIQRKQLETELEAKKLNGTVQSLEQKIKSIQREHHATKNAAKQLLEKSKKKTLNQAVEINRLNNRIKNVKLPKTSSE